MNAKYTFTFFAALAGLAGTLLAAAGCDREDRFLDIDTPVLEVGSEVQEVTVHISASSVWMTGFTPEWITAAVSDDWKSLRLVIQRNSEESDRSAPVPIVTGDGQEGTINVNQRGFDVVFNITPATLAEFPGPGGSQTFTVESNVDWSITYSDLWLSFEQDPDDRSLVTVTVDRNFELRERETSFTVGPTYANFDKYVKTVAVTQRGSQFAIHNDEYMRTGRITAKSEGEELLLYIVAAGEWEVADNGSLAVDPPGGGATGEEEAEVFVTVPPNDTSAEVIHTLRFSCNGEEHTLQIVQPGELEGQEPEEP